MSKPPTPVKFLRIGQLAARTGLSAKALRLYEVRGLLQPDAYSDAGYRQYGTKALVRLAEIGVLKRAGFTLAEIDALLKHQGSVVALIEARIVALRREVKSKSAALAALEYAWRRLDLTSQPDINQLLEIIQMSDKLDTRPGATEIEQLMRYGKILDKHLTDQERERIRARAEHFSDETVKQFHEWPQMIASMRAAMEAGTPPTEPAVIEMGHRWHALLGVLTGHDTFLEQMLKNVYNLAPRMLATPGRDPKLITYIREAMAAAGMKTFI